MGSAMAWLYELVSSTTSCTACGASYGIGNMRILSIYGHYWFVELKCPACGAESNKTVVSDDLKAAQKPPLTADQVLDAHDLLRYFTGDVHSLFGGRPIAHLGLLK